MATGSPAVQAAMADAIGTFWADVRELAQRIEALRQRWEESPPACRRGPPPGGL